VAQELAEQEPATVAWFSFRENATTFGVSDTLEDGDGRQAHLSGRIAAALGEAAQTKLSIPPVIASVDLLSKFPERCAAERVRETLDALLLGGELHRRRSAVGSTQAR
jgi:hypothetical protein